MKKISFLIYYGVYIYIKIKIRIRVKNNSVRILFLMEKHEE